MLDMRTIMMLTIAYSLFSGLAIILFAAYRKNVQGLFIMGSGIITNGLGFLLVSGRYYFPESVTVILANYFIFLGVSLILSGFTRFRQLQINWLYQRIVFSITLLVGFSFFTYINPSIKYRILIITAILLVQFIEILVVIFYKNNAASTKESLILSSFFVITIVILIARIVVTVIEEDLASFMSAGAVHAYATIIFQVMPFYLVITVFWISNTSMMRNLRELSMKDSLTKVYNHGAIIEIGQKLLADHQREHLPVSVVMCDIDNFKEINDTRGHLVGDQVIQTVSQALSIHIRQGDYLGRFGGEEFLLYLNIHDHVALEEKLEVLRHHIEQASPEDLAYKIPFTMSFGGFLCSEGSLEEAINKADQALYEAKEGGRNRVVIYKSVTNVPSL